MASPVFLADRLIALLQTVTDFFPVPCTFNKRKAADLITALETLRGNIQALPLRAQKKSDLLQCLDGTVSLLGDFISGVTTLSRVEVLLAVCGELEVLKQKVLALNLKPCASVVRVCVPAPFSTIAGK